MSYHQSSAALKAAAKEHMFGRYGSAVGAYLLVTFLTGFATISISSIAGGTNIRYTADKSEQCDPCLDRKRLIGVHPETV